MSDMGIGSRTLGPRLALLALLTILAVNGGTAAAMAEETAQPAFLGAEGNEVVEKAVKVTLGEVALTGGGVTLACKKGSASGEIEGISKVVGMHLTFTGCSAKATGECKVKSHEAKEEGEVVTNALVGELGAVAKSEAASEAGLELRPASGKDWAELRGKCLAGEGGALEGNVIGEVKGVGKASKEIVVGFSMLEGKSQKITKFVGGSKAGLDLLGHEAAFGVVLGFGLLEEGLVELVPVVTRSPTKINYGEIFPGEEPAGYIMYTNRGPMAWKPKAPIGIATMGGNPLIGPFQFKFVANLCTGKVIAVNGECELEVVRRELGSGAGTYEGRVTLVPALPVELVVIVK